MLKPNPLNTVSADAIAATAPANTKRIDPDVLYSTTETSLVTGVAVRTLEHWRSNGKGPPFIRFGGKLVKYRGAVLLAYAEVRSYNSTSEEAALAA